MMKKILTSFLFASVVSISFPAQVDSIYAVQNNEQSDGISKVEINIKEMVKDQIEASKQKQFNELMAASLHEIISVEEKNNITVNEIPVSKAIVFGVADLSVVIFLIAVVLTFIVIVINRIRSRRLKIGENNPQLFSTELLKQNIAMIRNEDPVLNRKESQLKSTRKNLRSVSLDKLKKNISATAKELQLSKGEILLTSNIKKIEREKVWNKMKGLKINNHFAEF